MTNPTAADEALARATSCLRNDYYDEMGQHALVSIAASLREIAEMMRADRTPLALNSTRPQP